MPVSLNCSQPNVVAAKNVKDVNFKGAYQRTENGTPYYKTNSGIKAGGVVAGTYALSAAIHASKGSVKNAIPYLGIGLMSIGCGAIVDKIRNKKAAEKADMIKEVGLKQAVLNDDSIELTRTGRGYYHSNDGVKTGGLLGFATGVISAILGLSFSSEVKEANKKIKEVARENKMNPQALKRKSNILAGCVTALVTGLGGLIMGKITDHLANNDARKNG